MLAHGFSAVLRCVLFSSSSRITPTPRPISASEGKESSIAHQPSSAGLPPFECATSHSNRGSPTGRITAESSRSGSERAAPRALGSDPTRAMGARLSPSATAGAGRSCFAEGKTDGLPSPNGSKSSRRRLDSFYYYSSVHTRIEGVQLTTVCGSASTPDSRATHSVRRQPSETAIMLFRMVGETGFHRPMDRTEGLPYWLGADARSHATTWPPGTIAHVSGCHVPQPWHVGPKAVPMPDAL